MPNISPPYLKKGDKVGVVAPAGKIDKQKTLPALDTIMSWGLNVVLGKNIYNSHGYFSGTDMERLSDLQTMLDDPDVKAVFCLRGGYGLTRIIDQLQLNSFIQNPKWIIGFSDITALHSKLALHSIESVHGIMPSLFIPDKARDSIEHLRSFLFGDVHKVKWGAHPANILGKATGYLRGGNLSILADSIGTCTAMETDNTILFLEEVDEFLYKIDRMLVHLERGRCLDTIKGLLVGHFTSIKDTSIPFGKKYEELILERTRHLGVPIAFGMPCGHDYPNLAFPHNRLVALEVSTTKSIIEF